jgi:cytosine/uracil/thiamine/allantoin permease
VGVPWSQLIPFMPLVSLGFEITFVVVMIMLIRWQVKFGRLKTEDPDYSRARRSRNIVLVLWVIAIPIGLIVKPLFGVILESLVG